MKIRPSFRPTSLLLTLALTGAASAETAITGTSATPAVSAPIRVEAGSGDEKKEAAEEASAEAAKSASEAKTPEELELEAMRQEKERLALENALMEERVRHETIRMREEIARLQAEKELISERIAHAAAKRAEAQQDEDAKMETEKAALAREAELAKARAEAAAAQLKAVQAEAGMEVTRLKGEIGRLEAEKERKFYADEGPVYLANPLRDDGTLVISDRRIALNGPISTATADNITERIHYFNNQDAELPIFLVIDESPGGSVMAGYRILKAMEASDAPIHVVVKSFAASMAASITTLAEESYCYPNAVILHHQISLNMMGRVNLTQQKEMVEESNRWWVRLATPIADKMGITTDEFIKRMYQHSSSGDWSEFGVEAQKLKWVNHIVSGIEETSILRSPDAESDKSKESPSRKTTILSEELDDEGRPVLYLPRINPKDVYFIYNPDGYYQLR